MFDETSPSGPVEDIDEEIENNIEKAEEVLSHLKEPIEVTSAEELVSHIGRPDSVLSPDEIVLKDGTTLVVDGDKITRLFTARKDYNGRIIDLSGEISEDEPVMMFRAKDKFFADVMDFYAKCVAHAKGDPNIVEAVRKHQKRAIDWQKTNFSHSPDMPKGGVV